MGTFPDERECFVGSHILVYALTLFSACWIAMEVTDYYVVLMVFGAALLFAQRRAVQFYLRRKILFSSVFKPLTAELLTTITALVIYVLAVNFALESSNYGPTRAVIGGTVCILAVFAAIAFYRASEIQAERQEAERFPHLRG